MFFLNSSNQLKIYSHDGRDDFNVLFSLQLDKENIYKIVFNEENSIFFGLTYDGKIYQFYLPSEMSLKISNDLEKEKREPIIKKIINPDNGIENYLCALIKLNLDDIFYFDIYIMKNFVILFDKYFDIYYFNIDNLKINFFYEHEITKDNIIVQNKSSSYNIIQNNQINIEFHRNLKDNSNYNKNEKNNLFNDFEINKEYLNNTNNESSEEINLEKNFTNKINLEANNKKKYFDYYNYLQTNFHEILLKLNKIQKGIIKIDCSESNLLFADEEQKVYYYYF